MIDCPRCVVLERELAELRARVASLEKDSSNSSKPPSSDIVKAENPKQKRGRSKRKRGAQPGHAKHRRPAFSTEEVDAAYDYYFDRCPDCGGEVKLLAEPASILQQVEFVERPIEISEHRSRTCHCTRCQKDFVATLPREVRKAGLVGPQLTALISYMKGACHCSFSTIRKFLRDVVKVTISCGQLRRVCAKVAHSLDNAYEGLLKWLPHQDFLNVDETGHKEYAKRMWTWCFRAPLFTLFHISPSRGSEVLLNVLGQEFDGVLGCDYFSAYHKYMRLNKNVLVQFCLAHLIRDVRFLVEHPNPKNQAYGKRLLAEIRKMFAIIHNRDKMTKADFLADLETQGVWVCHHAMFRVPNTKEAQNMADRFRKHGNEYIRFITTPGIQPTNNLAEQAIRFVVIDRRVTLGSRSKAGREWLERIWTTIATCAQQSKSVFVFLVQSINAFFAGTAGPSLRPEPG